MLKIIAYAKFLIKKNNFVCNCLGFILYHCGFVVYLYYKIKKKPYFGWYLFSNQDSYRGRSKKIIEVAEFFKKKNLDILEIGVYCGQTTVNLGSFFKKIKTNIQITCVDPFCNLVVKDDKQNIYSSYFYKNLKNNKIESLFDSNISFAELNRVVNKKKTFSINFFNRNKKKYDIIVIDGSHYFDDVNLDIKEAKKILNEGGVLIIDDYELEASKISFEELNQKVNTDEALYNDKIFYHPGITHAVKLNFNFNLSSHNGLGVVKYENNQFSNFFKL